MTNSRTTYELARNQIGAYVQPLVQGAVALEFEGRDQDGRLIKMTDDHLSGRTMIVVLMNQVNVDLLRLFVRQELGDHVSVVAVSAAEDAMSNRQMQKDSGFRWPILTDSTGALFASYGLHKLNDIDWRIVVLTPSRQVRGWIDSPEALQNTSDTLMEYLKLIDAADESRWNPPHAPVLLVPNVLSRAECAELIRSYESGGPFTVRPPRPGEFDGDYKIPVYEHNRQDRVDHIIRDPQTIQLLDSRLFSRVVPMIQKAFNFDVNRHEDLHIARYVGKRGGHEMGHRDNTSAATAYRKFALSVNLNDDFEGGEVVFNEYSPKGYRSEPGTALVFSSSLLHEVKETTQGVRYNLISHFFNQ